MDHNSRTKILTRERERRNKLLRFVRLNHGQSFGVDFLSRHLEIAPRDVKELLEGFVGMGYAVKDPFTEYYRGVAIHWPTEREAMAELFQVDLEKKPGEAA